MKPAKPSAAFPLFAHNNGQWAKKIRGKIHYFGSWDDPDAAVVKYKRCKRHPDAREKPDSESSKSTVNRKGATGHKPRKPHGDFPLYAHKNGQWAKKIRSKVHYFGPWGDSDGALQRYLDEKDDLNAGLTIAESMGAQPKVFPRIYIRTVSSADRGQKAGNVPTHGGAAE